MPIISRADFGDPALAAFLQEHLDDMEPTAPPFGSYVADPNSVFMIRSLRAAAP